MNFKIEKIYEPCKSIFYVVDPTGGYEYFITKGDGYFEVTFSYGPTFKVVAKNTWMYVENVNYKYSYSAIFNSGQLYTLEDLLNIAPKIMKEDIIFNLSDFREM